MLLQELINQCIRRMEESKGRVISCLEMLSEEEIWKRPNSHSNSVGNLVLHLCGNIRQYIISALGEEEDVRNREAEFSAEGGLSKSELIQRLSSTVEEAVSVMTGLTRDEALKTFSVQGFNLSGTGIIVHVVEHFSYHTGQIAFWTKLLRDQDLGFYAGFDLNKKNRE